jgi:2-furoyl-CoA dehydrogenase FAD binding subunit
MSTQLGPADILVRACFPAAGPGEGFGFAEFARRHGDFALAGIAVRVRRSPREAVVAAFGISDRPVVRGVTALLDDSGDTDVAQLARALAAPMAELAEQIVESDRPCG